MSWRKILAKAIISIILFIITLVGGKAWGKSEGEEERRTVNKENENLRKKIRSILEVFKAEVAKKNQNISWLEMVLKRLMKNPPANRAELIRQLQSMNLTGEQFEAVMDRMSPIYGGLLQIGSNHSN